MWFPDVIKHLQADDYASKVKTHNNEHIEDFTFNFTLENQIHSNGLFVNDRLEHARPHVRSIPIVIAYFKWLVGSVYSSPGLEFRSHSSVKC